MADAVHVKKFFEGIGCWNAWRTQHPDLIPDLRYASLAAAQGQFHAQPLNLRNALLLKADLRNGVLTGADMKYSELVETDLTGAMLQDADLEGAELTDAILVGADLTGASLRGADLTGADLTGAKNLTQSQIDAALGDQTTQLSAPLAMPRSWLAVSNLDGVMAQGRIKPDARLNRFGAEDDLYAHLGVKRGASDAGIHTAYRTGVKALHPDVNPGNAAADAAFRRLTHAYAILRDPERRARYDRGEIGPDGEDTAAFVKAREKRRRVRHLWRFTGVAAAVMAATAGLTLSQMAWLGPWIAAHVQNGAQRPAPDAVEPIAKLPAPSAEGAIARTKTQSRIENPVLVLPPAAAPDILNEPMPVEAETIGTAPEPEIFESRQSKTVSAAQTPEASAFAVVAPSAPPLFAMQGKPGLKLGPQIAALPVQPSPMIKIRQAATPPAKAPPHAFKHDRIMIILPGPRLAGNFHGPRVGGAYIAAAPVNTGWRDQWAVLSVLRDVEHCRSAVARNAAFGWVDVLRLSSRICKKEGRLKNITPASGPKLVVKPAAASGLRRKATSAKNDTPRNFYQKNSPPRRPAKAAAPVTPDWPQILAD